MKSIYLCGPINGCSDSDCKDWRNLVESKLVGFEVFDPMSRDYLGIEKTSTKEIVEGDKSDIDLCDMILVNYIKPSVGTSMEILYAYERNKVVITVADKSLVLSPWLVYHSHKIFNTMEDAIKYINFGK